MNSNWRRLFLFLLIVILLVRTLPFFYANVQLILVSKAYYNSHSVKASTSLLRNIMHISCIQSSEPYCWPERWASNEIVLEAADPFFDNDMNPLIVVTKSKRIPSNMLVPSGSSDANQLSENSGVLYGAGYFPLRVFLAADEKACWQFGIRAKHDDPAPVKLSLWLDDKMVGSTSFAKGDLSWETKYLYAEVESSTYWMQIWFDNDYFDEQQKADRNAYIEFVEIIYTEKAQCNDN